MSFTRHSGNGLEAGRILIADDLELNRLMLRMYLESLGHIVEEACNGAAALLALRTGQYDLAFIDYKMPKLSGELVIRQYRDRAPSATPIFVVTTEPSEEVRRSLLEAGAQNVIERPVTLEKLREVIGDRFKGVSPSSR